MDYSMQHRLDDLSKYSWTSPDPLVIFLGELSLFPLKTEVPELGFLVASWKECETKSTGKEGFSANTRDLFLVKSFVPFKEVDVQNMTSENIWESEASKELSNTHFCWDGESPPKWRFLLNDTNTGKVVAEFSKREIIETPTSEKMIVWYELNSEIVLQAKRAKDLAEIRSEISSLKRQASELELQISNSLKQQLEYTSKLMSLS